MARARAVITWNASAQTTDIYRLECPISRWGLHTTASQLRPQPGEHFLWSRQGCSLEQSLAGAVLRSRVGEVCGRTPRHRNWRESPGGHPHVIDVFVADWTISVTVPAGLGLVRQALLSPRVLTLDPPCHVMFGCHITAGTHDDKPFPAGAVASNWHSWPWFGSGCVTGILRGHDLLQPLGWFDVFWWKSVVGAPAIPATWRYVLHQRNRFRQYDINRWQWVDRGWHKERSTRQE